MSGPNSGQAESHALQTALVFLGPCLTSGAALAQGTTRLEFSFSNPGARGIGFGGAFIGLADDATAAYANPAGLVQLIRPEISIEARSWSYDTPFTVGGRASGFPTAIGIDTSAGLRFGLSSEDSSGISFASFVQPFPRWSLAVYRHQLASFESEFATMGLFAGPSLGATERRPDALSSTHLDHVGHGLSVAYRASETFSVGVGLSHVDGGTRIVEETFLPDDDTQRRPISHPTRSWSRDGSAAVNSSPAITTGLCSQASSGESPRPSASEASLVKDPTSRPMPSPAPDRLSIRTCLRDPPFDSIPCSRRPTSSDSASQLEPRATH